MKYLRSKWYFLIAIIVMASNAIIQFVDGRTIFAVLDVVYTVCFGIAYWQMKKKDSQ